MSSVSDPAVARTDESSRAGGAVWTRGFAGGVVAFGLGYAVIVAVVFGFGDVRGGLGDVLKLVGVVFYNAHNVPAVGGGLTVDVLRAARNPNVPVVVYYAVPVVVTAAAGAAVTAASRAPEPESILHAGGALAVGYAAVAATGALALSVPLNLGAPVSPDVTKAVVFGLAYPVVFGTVGAAVGYGLRANRA